LIAWVSTDPYLRDAATTLSHQRAIAMPLFSETRSAKAAMAAWFVLACAAVMGITDIASHGRAVAQGTVAQGTVAQGTVAQGTVATSPLVARGNGTATGRGRFAILPPPADAKPQRRR
jgi:hypothetical protein